MTTATTKGTNPQAKSGGAAPSAASVVQPYLFFGGRCEEAIAFYGKAVGAKVDMVMKYKDAPQSPPPGMLPPGYENKVMHSQFRIGESTIMGSDGCGGDQAHEGFSLSLSAKSVAEADRAFAALSEGGKVTMPIAKTFWSERFGMLTDKFGIGWMVGFHTEQPK